MKKFFVSLLLLLSMALSYALPPLEGFWEQDALFSSDYGIRITEHYIHVFDRTIENRKAQTFKYEEIYEGTISIYNFNVSLASEYPEFRSNYFSYERDGNKLVLRGNYGGEIKLKRTPDTPYMADFWCEDKIGNSRFFLDVSYDKFIYVAKDGGFANVWEIERLNATDKWIKLKHQDYISSEVDDVLRNHLMKSDYVRYDRKGEKMTLDLLTGKLKLVTDTRKTFVKNAAIGVGVTAAVVTAAVVGYNVYNSYQQSADNGQKQSYNNGKTSSGTGGKNVAASITNTSSNSYKPYIFFNKTHKDSLPKPKGDGPNGGALQSHHGLQQEWAKANLSKYGYDPKLAPTVTLETGTNLPHTIISNAQNRRRDAREAAGMGKWDSSIEDELSYIVSDFREAGFSDSVIEQVLEQQYKMLDKLGVPYTRVKF